MKKNIIAVSLLLLFGCSLPSQETEKEFESPYLIEQLHSYVANGDYSGMDATVAKIKELYPGSYDEKYADIYAESFNNVRNQQEQENVMQTENVDFTKVIQLLSIKTDEPNSAGGINLYIKWKNTSDKTVKYAYFTCELYNAVDDKVNDTISGSYKFTGKVTGPVQPNEIKGKDTYWQNAWWNNSGRYAKIIGIELEYMDGSKITVPTNKIDELFYK